MPTKKRATPRPDPALKAIDNHLCATKTLSELML
jgi:hypothetical protein